MRLAEFASWIARFGCLVLGACRGAPERAQKVGALEPSVATSPARVGVAQGEQRASEWRKLPEPNPSDWCIDGVPALDEQTCFILPERRSTRLLVYLHGIVPPGKVSPIKTNLQTVVANAARRAGVVALIPRGRRGLAPKTHAGYWGWPTSERAYRAYAPELARQFAAARSRLEQRLDVRFSSVYLAGSSAGAYFAAALALHGGFEADGFGAMSGGAGFQTRELANLRPRPFYIGYGRYDSVAPSSRALAELLRAAGWPVKLAAHPGGHGAREVYLDEAFAFWAGTPPPD